MKDVDEQPVQLALPKREGGQFFDATRCLAAESASVGQHWQLPDVSWLLAGAAKYMNDAVPQLIAGCKDKDHNVRQCSVYGLGILAQQHHKAFRASLQGALMAILGIITAPGARSVASMMHLYGV